VNIAVVKALDSRAVKLSSTKVEIIEK
jgi:hypothetical protein